MSSSLFAYGWPGRDVIMPLQRSKFKMGQSKDRNSHDQKDHGRWPSCKIIAVGESEDWKAAVLALMVPILLVGLCVLSLLLRRLIRARGVLGWTHSRQRKAPSQELQPAL